MTIWKKVLFSWRWNCWNWSKVSGIKTKTSWKGCCRKGSC